MRSYTLEDLAVEFLGERPQPSSPLIEAAGAVSLSAAAAAATQDADIALRLEEPLTSASTKRGWPASTRTMELPLVEVLADMERAGVKIDVPLLADMSRDMEQQIDDLTVRIHELAGGPFNINSPIQLRDILFEQARHEVGRRRRPRRGPPRRRRKCSRSWPASRAAAQDPRVPRGAEAQVHLRRRAARSW